MKKNVYLLSLAFFLIITGNLFAQKKVGYFTYDKSTEKPDDWHAAAAKSDDDPIIRMLKADPNFEVTVNLTDPAGTADLSGYDLVIVQESFSSSSDILKPGGDLGLASITVPFIYNKSYAFKAGRAFADGTEGGGAEQEGDGFFYLRVGSREQRNPLFSGITFALDSVALFNATTDDNANPEGDREKALNYASGVVISEASTRLGSPAIMKPGDEATVCVNDIPAGATIGSETLQAQMIALGMNYGAMCANNGSNITNDGLTLWRNAAYILTGLDVPEEGVVASGEISEVSAAAGMIAMDADGKAIQLNLPMGTSTTELTITPAETGATVDIPSFSVSNGETISVDVTVTSAINGVSEVYKLAVHGQSDNEILYVSASPVYSSAKAFDTNVYDALVAAGYSVTLAKKDILNEFTPDGDIPFDYTPYKGIVIGGGVGSSNTVYFADNDYPIPCVTLQNDGPKNNKWGWINDKKAEEFYKIKESWDETDVQLQVINNTHPITAGYAMDEIITWNGGSVGDPDFVNGEIKSYNLTDSVPEAIALAKTNVGGGEAYPAVWAIPAGTSLRSFRSGNTWERVNSKSNIVLLYLYNDGLLYATDAFGTLLTNSLDWAINGGGETPEPEEIKEVLFVTIEDSKDTVVIQAINANPQFNVTTLTPADGIPTEDMLPELNAADVVIIGRNIGSSNVGAGMAVWDAITAPVLSMNMWGMRGQANKAYWTPSTVCENLKNGVDTFITATILMPEDPVFEGISGTIDWWEGNYSIFGPDEDGDDAGNGTLLAETPDGRPLLMRWEAGVEFYPESGHAAPAGPRSYIGNGSDDGGVDNYFSFSDVAEHIFFNELARLTGGELKVYEKPEELKNIIFVTDDSMDSLQIDWLTKNGLEVTTYYAPDGLSAAPQEEIDALNAADLVIVGRSPNSGDFDGDDKPVWNGITTPMIFNSQWAVRSNRVNMFNSGSAIHADEEPDVVNATIATADDAAFSTVTVTDGLLDWCVKPHDFIEGVEASNGTILASWDQDATVPLFARFEANVEYYEGSVDMPAGPRTYFGFGNDATGLVNFFPLTENAQKVYFAEILNMLGMPIAEPTFFQSLPKKSGIQHSYTFEDGTATDVVGGANGVLEGGATIVDGSVVFADGQYLSLPAADINIGSYEEATIEVVFTPESGANANYHTVFAFGRAATTGFGADYIQMQPSRGDDVTRIAISAGNETEPWSVEDGVNTDEMNEGMHYVAGVINADGISLYLDGAFIGTTPYTGANALSAVSSEIAYLGKSVYPNDPTWVGSIQEFNIYNVSLSADEIAANAEAHGIQKTTEIVFVTVDDSKDSTVIQAINARPEYNVTTVTAGGAGVITEDLLPELNAADVVIMGRNIGSNDVKAAADVWDMVGRPVLTMNMWGLRSSRALWTPSGDCENVTSNPDTVLVASILTDDPVFEGMTGTIDWWSGNFSIFGPDAEDDDAGNGTLLAETPDGRMMFARWEAGVEFYEGAGHAPTNERSYIGNGSDANEIDNYFAFSDAVKTVFFNEIDRLAKLETKEPPTVVDTEAPSAPANVAATADGNSVTVTWEASTDNVAVTGYNVYQDGTAIAEGTTELTVTASDLADATYKFEVEAIDEAGNVSAKGEATVEVNTTAIADFDYASLKMYPNPVNNILTIAAPELQEVQLVDVAGRVISIVKVNGANQEINMSQLQKGIYLVNLKMNSGIVVTQKVIKK